MATAGCAVWLLVCSGYWYLVTIWLLLSVAAGTDNVWLLVPVWLQACCLLLPVLMLSGYWYMSGDWPSVCYYGTDAVWLLVYLITVWLPACCLLLLVLLLSGYWYMSGHHLVTGLLSVAAGTDAVWLLSLVTGMLWCGYCEEAQLSVLTWQRVNKNSGDCAQLKLGSLNCRACSVSESWSRCPYR